MVLTGESESEKSIIMKIMMLFRTLYADINVSSIKILSKSKDVQKDFNYMINSIDIVRIMESVELYEFMIPNSELICVIDGFKMKICVDNKIIHFKVSGSFNLNKVHLEDICYLPNYRLIVNVIHKNKNLKDQSVYLNFYNNLVHFCDFTPNFDNNKIIKSFLYKKIENLMFESHTFFIEELELGSHPNKQVQLINDIVNKFNTTSNTNIIFSTNSPYILSYLNCLLYAYSVFKKKIDCTNIVPKTYFLNVKDIAVYNIINGKSKNIINNKTKLILADTIDGISETIGEMFDNLLDLYHT